jgi:signal transduction histidine kinase
MGVANMRDRAAALGGTMSIESVDPSGTRIIVRVPANPSVPVTGDPDIAAPGVTEP